jgi:hypothetical protein
MVLGDVMKIYLTTSIYTVVQDLPHVAPELHESCSSGTICFRIYMLHVVLEVSIVPDLHESCSSGSLHRSGKM